MKKNLLPGRRYDGRAESILFNPASNAMSSSSVFSILQMNKLRFREMKQSTQGQVVELGFTYKSDDYRA